MKQILSKIFKVKKREVYDVASSCYQTAKDLYFLNIYINTTYE